MTKMTYAEAVKRLANTMGEAHSKRKVLYTGEIASSRTREGIEQENQADDEALAVLRGAEKVMGAVEQAKVDDYWDEETKKFPRTKRRFKDEDFILCACLRYRDEKEKP